MRLTNHQKTTILNSCQRYFGNSECWVFSSRVDDQNAVVALIYISKLQKESLTRRTKN